ncbi:hypothetical protein [Paraglaciecola hydrolytica]|jgi:hypothetical protein|uniref:DUF3784 domain-containing protein n=1 Tax=Paraglaciecola hydrolytica TaxID=1799789 RepID=A0A148KLT2_9ALTE|nr:hypothetical protein [Paraglaciecola hydrolytica]KXI27219.1 hypothetical protein AX660_01230 [Paraglaciecola hydrolytica]
MEVYEYDLVALLILIIGLYVLTKNELEFTLSVGPTKLNGLVDDNSKYTKRKKGNLGKIQTKIFGCALIATSFLMYSTIKGELAFVW